MSQHSISNRVVPTRSGVQYTPEQWAAKRDIITRLYAREGKSLREVKEVLRLRYDFRPTCVNMFSSLLQHVLTDGSMS